MKWTNYIWVALALLLSDPSDLFAASGKGPRWFQVNGRIRLEYDDNIYLTDDNTEGSAKVIAEAELFANFNMEQTFLSLRWRPSYTYWDNREGDDSDFNNAFDLVLNHSFTPRFALSLKDTLRVSQLPGLIDPNELLNLSTNDDYLFNMLAGTLNYKFTPEMSTELSGRYDLLQYDEEETALINDYDLYVLGWDLLYRTVPETVLRGQLRYSDISYDGPDRGSESVQIGGAVDQTFSPNMLGTARLGYENKSYNDANTDSTDAPYIDGQFTYLPSPATRLSAGAGYSLSDTDVFPFTNQDQTQLYLSLAHDWTARVALFFTSSYTLGGLNAEETVAGSEPVEDGSDNFFQMSTRLTYRLNRSNLLETSWVLSDLDSDVRESYTRNRLNVGWKVEL